MSARKRWSSIFLGALLCSLLLGSLAWGEVQLFVDKQTVRVHDPELGKQSILNSFQPKGWRTHNYFALVWNDQEGWVYDIRTHQWIPLKNFAPLSGFLSDNFALVWEPNRVAIFDAAGRNWMVSDFSMDTITNPLLSRGMGAVTTRKEFVVYDPVLHTWEIYDDVYPKQAALGDNLAICWNETDAFIYDTTTHQWIEKRGISPQACIVEDYKITIFTADSILTYDAMSHRWKSEER